MQTALHLGTVSQTLATQIHDTGQSQQFLNTETQDFRMHSSRINHFKAIKVSSADIEAVTQCSREQLGDKEGFLKNATKAAGEQIPQDGPQRVLQDDV